MQNNRLGSAGNPEAKRSLPPSWDLHSVMGRAGQDEGGQQATGSPTKEAPSGALASGGLHSGGARR